MTRLTPVFLVLLRLAIGWHFFFEGWEKVRSVRLGKTETNRPWSSEGYLRESTGPVSRYFRGQAGPDPDEEALSLLVVAPLAPGQDAAKTPLYQRMPAAMSARWHSYFDRFVQHYALSDQQIRLAEKKFQQRQDETVRWLLSGVKTIKRTYPSGTVAMDLTTPQRVEYYRAKLLHLQEMTEKTMPALGRDVFKQKLAVTKAEVTRLRRDLLGDLDEQTTEMKKALTEDVLNADQKARGPVDVPPAARPLEWIDLITSYGLTAVGACLLLGLFTRSACVAGACFLLMFYLSMPPLPWLPENPKVEGHYLYVNKNLIEMLALLTLATTASGRWVGLDGLVRLLFPWNRRPDSDQYSPSLSEKHVETHSAGRGQSARPGHPHERPAHAPPSSLKEPPHGP
jgi:uncharacterized membrane protein YphA (DoxX/SURF4 family)